MIVKRACLFSMLCASLALAGDANTKTLAASAGRDAGPASAPAVEVRAPEIEGYDYSNEDGLYATVVSMQSFKKPDIKNDRKIKLKGIEGFRKDIEVRAILQHKPAPMVVIFLGLTSKSKDPLARLWQAQLGEAGCHVLVFDSIFRPSFNERSCHGVAGNLRAEATVAASVISAFLQHPEVNGKVTSLNLLGASYGGTLAINFANLAAEGKIALKPERVLAFSPPVNMQTAAAVLDRFHDEDTEQTGVFDLLRMKMHEPAPGKPNPFSPSQMRGGIGYIFHEDLKDAVDCAKDVYKYRLPDKDDKQRIFTRFVEQCVYPYWWTEGKVKTIDEIWSFGDLHKLLKAAPDSVQVVLAQDDPLNDPAQLLALQRDTPAGKLTVVPRGGHLGYLGCRWSKERVTQFFK